MCSLKVCICACFLQPLNNFSLWLYCLLTQLQLLHYLKEKKTKKLKSCWSLAFATTSFCSIKPCQDGNQWSGFPSGWLPGWVRTAVPRDPRGISAVWLVEVFCVNFISLHSSRASQSLSAFALNCSGAAAQSLVGEVLLERNKLLSSLFSSCCYQASCEMGGRWPSCVSSTAWVCAWGGRGVAPPWGSAHFSLSLIWYLLLIW